MGRSVVERARGRPRCGSSRGVRGSGRSTCAELLAPPPPEPPSRESSPASSRQPSPGDADADSPGGGTGTRTRPRTLGTSAGRDLDVAFAAVGVDSTEMGPAPPPDRGRLPIVGGPQPQPRPRIRPQHVRGYLARRAFRRTRRGRARTPRPGCLPHARVPPRVFPRRASVTRGGVPRDCAAARVLAGAGATSVEDATEASRRALRRRAWAYLHFSVSLCGAALVKWAQWASVRRDMFPEDFCAAP